MREVQSADAKSRLPELLNAVEQGETIIITRHGRAIARLVPDDDRRRDRTMKAMERLAAFRKTMPSLTAAEIVDARREGQRDE